MKVAGKVRRSPKLALPLLAVTFGLLSCAPATNSAGGSSDSSAVTAPDQMAMNGTDTSAMPIVDPSTASTRVLAKASSTTAGLDLVEAPSINQLVLHSDIAADSVSTERLSNPERLVIDLPSNATIKNGTFMTAQSEYVSRVRIGAHPDKTRIVMDLPSTATSIQSKVENKDGALVIDLYEGGADMKAAPKPEMLDTSTPKDVTTTSDAITTTTPDTTTVAATLPLKPVLKDLKFEELSAKDNSLVLDMDAAGFYTLKKTAPSEYILKLDDATTASTVAPLLVAKPGTGKIRSVRASEKDGGTILRIFADPNSNLKAESQSGHIIVSSATTLKDSMMSADTTASGPRAQFAPDKVETKDANGGKADVKVEPADATTTAANKQSDEKELNGLLGDQEYHGRLISLDLQDTDIDNALRIIAEVSNLNIVTTEDVAGKVTLRLIDVPWDQALDVILKINNLGKVQEGNVIRIAPLEKLRSERESLKQAKVAEEQLEELKVQYLRISYARAADLKPLVESVLSERGTVTYDERSNQLIVKDTKLGSGRVVELVKKLDLRTPQVLLETQIVESTRDFSRQLGTKLGFNFSQAPATGNAFGYNFPNSAVGGISSNNLGTLDNTSPGFLNVLFGSADGSKSLSLTLAAAEDEGLARIISRPSVATTNNKQATIKSVQTIYVKLPSGGNSVSVGQGAASGGSTDATQSIEAGIILEVTPQASPDYYVLLDVNAQSSSFVTNSTTVDGIPTEIKRSATSTVLVSSGQTFVLGGIYKITENMDLNGVPFLKDVPFLGHLFRFSNLSDADEELLFFITPRIIEGSFDDAAMKTS